MRNRGVWVKWAKRRAQIAAIAAALGFGSWSVWNAATANAANLPTSIMLILLFPFPYRLHMSGTDEKPSGLSCNSQWQSPRCFILKPFALYFS